MEEIIARIKEYVLVIYPAILTDLGISDDFLNFVIAQVVDKALVIMNRAQFVAKYEADLLDDTVDASKYFLPIPKEVERTLATTIVGAARTIKSGNTGTTGNIKKIADNGQEIMYGDNLAHFFTSGGDSEVFGGSLAILKRYLMGTVNATTC